MPSQIAIIRSTDTGSVVQPEAKSPESAIGGKANTEARRAFFEEAAACTPIVAVRDRSGQTFLLGAGERGDPRMMFTKGQSLAGRALKWAVDHLRTADLLGESNHFVDIGAEIGVTAILAIREHGFDRTIAVEPNPGKYRLLCANGALNGLANRIDAVHVEPRAGHSMILRRGKRWCDYKPIAKQGAAEAIRKGKAIDVESASLDDLAARGLLDPAEIGLVRIGSCENPAAVLEGMRGFAPRTPMLLELDGRVLKDSESVSRLDTALVARFDGRVELIGLSPKGGNPCDCIAELGGDSALKTASVLALGS